MDPADDDGRSPSPVPDPEARVGGSGWGSDKPPPTRAEEGRVVGKAAMEPSPSPPDSTVSDQVALSSPPVPVPEDDDLTRAVSLLSLATLPAPRAVDPSPPSSAVSSHGHKDDNDLAGVNKRTHARFLVTHAQAGLIIGMGGSTVAAVEARSGARVKLSRHDQLLPGTDRRVVLVHGLLSQVMDAMEVLLQRLLLYQVQGDQAVDSEPTLVLVVPQPCCGVLIGKGGSVIKEVIMRGTSEAIRAAEAMIMHRVSVASGNLMGRRGGAAPLLNHLQRQSLADPGFHHAGQLDVEDKVANVFWVDAKMVADYAHFGDAVAFDVVSRNSISLRHLASFVGCNSFGEPVVFGLALMYDESCESFRWLFQTFLHAMSGRAPKTFISHQDTASGDSQHNQIHP
ncbi:Protein FAR1-RELATED SEQUENCE 3 [Triticum urartu]|uniref:Protein FAR1-RELATED SEQUENCE n=1 Tax=Triticum urartu TaxID=4572 RepID=M8AVC3_TRIUA|nr:Protein FAR1-RELATED SEQUENCE 3 [Triticum urartu]